ncbi:ketopantoate reductase family protein [Kribbella sp. NPDC059898]|uniref:ketopantoate reductase family protein n=1 Tax=Kribbella sp. NPDC059898 TaxID=3346995 RepID=UPI003668FD8C
MRILMFGRGVIATIYGHALQAAGHDIEFYVRPGRAAEYGGGVEVDVIDVRRGWRDRRIREFFPSRLTETLEPGDAFDLVILSVGHHRLTEAAAFLAPRIGTTPVLVFGNVWDEPATAPLPPEQVVYGFPQAGGGFADDGVLHGAMFRSVLLERSSRAQAVQLLFHQAGFTVREQEDMHGWLQIHFVADAGMFAQSIQSGSMARMVGDCRALRGALVTTRELLPVLTARGVDLRRHSNTLAPYRMPSPTAAAMAVATKYVSVAQVSMAAHTDPFAPEARAVLQDTLTAVRRHDVHAPRLEAATRKSRTDL